MAFISIMNYSYAPHCSLFRAMGIRQLTWRWNRILNKAELKCQTFGALRLSTVSTPQISAADARRAESLY